MKNTQIKTILKVIIFLIIGILLFGILNMIFVPKWIGEIDPATPRVKGFYEEPRDTIDVLFMGNSDVGRGISPITLWQEYGITSYNYGTSNQTMSLSYYCLKEVLQYQNIKTLVLDMDGAFVEKNAPEGEYRKLFDNMKWGKVKAEAIQDKNLKIKNKKKLSYLFPILRFHSRWNELKKEDFRITKKYYHSTSYKGMAMSNKVDPYNEGYSYMQDNGKIAKISEENRMYLQKIVELCKQENVQLLLISLPSASSWSSDKSKATTDFAKENQLQFIDMNYTIEGLDFNWKTDTADGGNHLNISGAEKVSRYLGKILKETYHTADHRNEEEYKENWNEEAKRYERNKQRLIDNMKNKKSESKQKDNLR